MKRFTAFLLCLGLVLGLCGINVAAATAETAKPQPKTTSYFYSDEDGMPETQHNYTNGMDDYWYIIREGAASISVTFSSDTYTESGYDKIYIYDGANALQGEYTGTALADQTVTVEGDTLCIRMTTDGSVVYYGFSVVDIYYETAADESSEEAPESSEETAEESVGEESSLPEEESVDPNADEYFYYDSDGMPESEHNYSNNTEKSWFIIRNGAASISVTFSEDTRTESCDYIYIYDENGEQQGCYSGTQLAGATVTVEGGVFQIFFDSDYSVTYYGFRVTAIEYETAFSTYTVAVTENGDGTADISVTAPQGALSGNISLKTSANLEYIEGSATAEQYSQIGTDNAAQNGITASFDNAGSGIDSATPVFSAKYNIVGAATLYESDIIVEDWFLEHANISFSDADGEVEKIISYCQIPTYTAHMYYNEDNTVSVSVTVPAGVSYGRISFTTTDNLAIIEDAFASSLDSLSGGSWSVGYAEGSGYIVEFEYDELLAENTTVVTAKFNVEAGYELAVEDFIVTAWNIGNGDGIIADQDDRNIIKLVASTVTVTVLNWDGSVLGRFTAPCNVTLSSVPFTPEREGRTFIGWDVSPLCFTEDTTITAQFSEAAFTVTFTDYDGTVLGTASVGGNGSVSTDIVPQRLGYEFTGWDISLDNITEDCTATAVYERTFVVGDANLDGTVNSIDASTILKHDATLIALQGLGALCGDVNWNGTINSIDASMLLQYDADILTELPSCPIYALVADGDYFRAGITQTITFTVSAGAPYEYFELYDQYGAFIGVMRDDGTGADLRANDGTYALKADVVYYIDGISQDVQFYCCYGEDRSMPLTLTFLSADYGSLSGVVRKASDRVTPVEGATVKVYSGANLYTTVYTNNDGQYSFTLPDGNYKVVVSANGYINFIAHVSIENGYDTYLETLLMVENTGAAYGVAEGVIKNSLTGDGEEAVSITFIKDWYNASSPNTLDYTAITNAEGEYSVELPLGNYTAVINKEGFTESSFNIVVCDGTTANQDGVITPVIEDGELGDSYLITLTWGENPRDLDSHVRGPLLGGGTFHTYYSDKTETDGDTQVCNLDYDDVSSYGPEHITLVPTTDGAYYYYVYLYSGSGTLATSDATVTVERGNRVIATFHVPTDQGNGRYWNIFAIKDGEIVINNRIESDYDVSYAE